MLWSTSLASRILRSQQSVKCKSRVDIAAKSLETILRKNFMPCLMIVGITVKRYGVKRLR